MTGETGRDDDDLLLRLEGGDERALTELFARHRERLRRMIRLRLDQRLQERIDSSEVLQEAYLEVARRAAEYVAQPSMPPFLWRGRAGLGPVQDRREQPLHSCPGAAQGAAQGHARISRRLVGCQPSIDWLEYRLQAARTG